MQIKFTPVLRNCGELQTLKSKVVILIQEPGNLIRQERKDVVSSKFASVSVQNAFVPQSIVATAAPAFQKIAPDACVLWHAPRYSL